MYLKWQFCFIEEFLSSVWPGLPSLCFLKEQTESMIPCVERSAYKVRWLSDGRWKCDRGPSGCGVYTGNQHRSIETNKICPLFDTMSYSKNFNWYLIRNVHIWDLLDIFTISIGVYSAWDGNQSMVALMCFHWSSRRTERTLTFLIFLWNWSWRSQ